MLDSIKKRFRVMSSKTRIYLDENTNFFVHGSFDVVFASAVLLLFTFGIIMMYSASYAYSAYYEGSPTAIFFDQLKTSAIGFAAMILISKLDYRILNGRLAWVAFYLTIGVLCATILIAKITGAETGRWLDIGISVQPSEFAKLTMIIVLSYLMTAMRGGLRAPKGKIGTFNPKADSFAILEARLFKWARTPFKCCFVIAAVICIYCGLVVLQKHLSATILFFFMGYFMLMLSGTKKSYFIIVTLIIVGAVLIVLSNPDIIKGLGFGTHRITVWLDKMNPAYVDDRRQTVNGLYAIGSGGLLGVGFGNSRQKQLYIPELHNDFVFPVVCEELGFLGAAAVIILFAFLIFRGFKIAKECNDYFGSMLVMGVMIQIGLQVIINIAVVTDLFPNTGMGLPFFSSGGSSIISILMEMGLVLSVSRRSAIEKK
ncbi:MAG: FtsW/RodA/SpoVE family cell cycle protein [Clostridia bacterium]|nr:FtsW/RodA/SpoVE family cell cycle protein [Clostridia bacterium]MBQ1967490.1 FtsW/RodA/SpoVE family cell cycle protein [Clostridia bacterium]MBQ1995851.1 FtsW/RodA/SpoVE family cell cycle protein [Clostridia bacterium]